MSEAYRKLAAFEVCRTHPTRRARFTSAKIINVMEGVLDVETRDATFRLTAGMSFAVGTGRWCRLVPQRPTRFWSIYIDEGFLRTQMAWCLPDVRRVQPRFHPTDWDGEPLVLRHGMSTLRRAEPAWRQLSVLRSSNASIEGTAVRTIELFARWIGVILPAFLEDDTVPPMTQELWTPIRGTLSDGKIPRQISHAADLLRTRLTESWSIERLVGETSLSRTHLTRLFIAHTGTAPMRYLTEVRITEFARMIEETSLSVSQSAARVGWADSRVASSWFRRRYGITPTAYRAAPHGGDHDER